MLLIFWVIASRNHSLLLCPGSNKASITSASLFGTLTPSCTVDSSVRGLNQTDAPFLFPFGAGIVFSSRSLLHFKLPRFQAKPIRESLRKVYPVYSLLPCYQVNWIHVRASIFGKATVTWLIPASALSNTPKEH